MKIKLIKLFAFCACAAAALSGCALRVEPAPDADVTLEPSATEPAFTEPTAPDIAVDEPFVTEPVITEPKVTEPEINEPDVTELEIDEPLVTEPEADGDIIRVEKTMYAAASVNVRSGPGVDFGRLGHLIKNEPADVTGIHKNGWYRIVFKDGEGYVSGDYLIEKLDSSDMDGE